MKFPLLVVAFCAVAWGSLLVQQQEQLSVLSRTMLTTAKEMQATQQEVLETLNADLVRVFVDSNVQMAEIHRETGEFIEQYNMTDEYCIEIVGYMYWARAEEVVEAVQLCADEVIRGIEGAWLEDVLGQVRLKSTEVMMLVLRQLSKQGDSREVEETVGQEVTRIEMEWSEMIKVLNKSVEGLVQFRQNVVQQTQNCTNEAVEQYDFHMGFLRYYMNKNEHCRR